MKKLDPIPYAIVSFVICLVLLFGVNYVFQVLIDKQPYEPRVAMYIIVAAAAAVGGYIQRARQQNE